MLSLLLLLDGISAFALIKQGIFHAQAVRIEMWAKILLCVEPIQLVQCDVTDTNHVRGVVQ